MRKICMYNNKIVHTNISMTRQCNLVWYCHRHVDCALPELSPYLWNLKFLNIYMQAYLSILLSSLLLVDPSGSCNMQFDMFFYLCSLENRNEIVSKNSRATWISVSYLHQFSIFVLFIECLLIAGILLKIQKPERANASGRVAALPCGTVQCNFIERRFI